MTTDTANRIWILGAADPEMTAIETLLLSAGERVAHACSANNERVHAGNAYAATYHRYQVPCGTAGDSTERWYLVECEVPTPDGCPVVHIDHHRAGDPGFGRPPSEFLEASSIGQVFAVLNRRCSCCDIAEIAADSWICPCIHEDDPPHEHVWYLPEPPISLALIAAADHCLGAAYRGECPGVESGELMRWRVESRASFQRRSVEAILADISATSAALEVAPKICLADYDDRLCDSTDAALCDEITQVTVRDMRNETPWPELPEAACYLGEGYLAGPLADPDGRRKVLCSGSAKQIRAFLSVFAPTNGLVDTYGDPARGFAGGYLP